MARQLRGSRPIVLTTCIVLAGLLATAGLAQVENPKPVRTTSDPDAIARRIGIDSCVSRGCHGAVGTVDPLVDKLYVRGGEAVTWRSFDPHARAFNVLLEPRSVRMGEILAAELKGKPPHKAALCLDCHSIGGEPDGRRPETEFAAGVDCETCHGPASGWIDPHLSQGWTKRPDAEKIGLGFRPISALPDRAQLCATCHVGDSSREVNHDLIAAGHPRLNFEFSSFHSAMPRHWREEHEKAEPPRPAGDFHARLWAIGQVATAEAVGSLLKVRSERGAAEKAAWPEFAEFDCFACHHDLILNSWRQDRLNESPGAPQWASWFIPGTIDLASKANRPDAAKSLSALQSEMSRAVPDPNKVAALADDSTRALRTWLTTPDAFRFDRDRAEASLRSNLGSKLAPPASWDEAAARSNAAEALGRAWRDLTGGSLPADLDREARSLRNPLIFPERYDSPKGYRP